MTVFTPLTAHNSHLVICIHIHVHRFVPIDSAARALRGERAGDSLTARDRREPILGWRMVAPAVQPQDADFMQNRPKCPPAPLRRRRPFSTPESVRDDPGRSGYLRRTLYAMREPPDR